MVCSICKSPLAQTGDCCNTYCSENPANYPVSPHKQLIDKAMAQLAKGFANSMVNGQSTICFCGICKECKEAVAKDEKDAKIKEQATGWDKCECGSEATGSSRHSHYCPKFRAVE